MNRTIIELKAGVKYRVVRPGARLSRTVPAGHMCMTSERTKLEVGEEIEFVGYKNCWGSDPVPVANFKYGDFKGEFWPNDWGIPEYGYLEEIV